MTNQQNLTVIGRAEKIDFIDHNVQGVIAKVDTGADGSSLWASDISRHADGSLSFVLFGKKNPFYTGTPIILPKGEYTQTRVANSFGDKELRYVVKLRVRVHGRVIRASFSLADRSTKTYPILLGRRFLHKKFLVDVSQGTPLSAEEKEKYQRMRVELDKNKD